MKNRLLTIATAALLLTGMHTALQAAMPTQKSPEELCDMCKTMDSEHCRQMMREMVKRKDLHRTMAEELIQNSDFSQTWQELHKHQSAHGG